MGNLKCYGEKFHLEKISFFISPFIGVFLLELVIRGDLILTKEWIVNSLFIYLFTVIIFLVFQLLILSVVNNFYVSIFLTYFVFGLIFLINKYKLELMDAPFLPWDFLFINQFINLIPSIYKSIDLIGLIGSMLLLVVISVILIKYTNFRALNVWLRLVLSTFSIVFLFLLSDFYGNFFKNFFDEVGIVRNQSDQKMNQQTNGLILGFVLNIPSVLIDKPTNYSSKDIDKDIESIPKRNYYTSNLKPNIVIVMSEAFWELDNVSVFDNEETLHPNISKYKIGHLISSNYGGGTANIEFEVLTGFSMNNLPHGSVAYQQYVKREIPSLPKILIDEGYRTSAFHTYNKFFWNREEVYDLLGFEKFIGFEDLENPTYNGLFIDDVVINDLIINEIEHNQDPSFIYAITMQNHGGYQDDRYGENTLQISNLLSNESNQILNTYGTGIKYSDQLFKDLIAEIDKINEPTLVVFFGDHLPALSNVYEETGYVKDMESKTLEEELKMKQTPLAIWKNYGETVEKIPNISASFLAPKVLQWAEIEGPLFYDFLSDFQTKIPGYTSLVKLDGNGHLSREVPDKYMLEDEIYKRIQYDILFGEDYYQKEFFSIN